MLGQPSVGQDLLDDDREAGVTRLGERRFRRPFEQVPRRLHGVEQRSAVDVDVDRPAHRVGLPYTADADADCDPAVAQAGQCGKDRGIIEDAALRCCRVDLIQRQVITENGPALGELATQSIETVVLDLVTLDVDAPRCGVRVAPFRSDHGLPGCAMTGTKP